MRINQLPSQGRKKKKKKSRICHFYLVPPLFDLIIDSANPVRKGCQECLEMVPVRCTHSYADWGCNSATLHEAYFSGSPAVPNNPTSFLVTSECPSFPRRQSRTDSAVCTLHASVWNAGVSMSALGSKVTSDQQLTIYTTQPADIVTQGAAGWDSFLFGGTRVCY